MVLIYGRQRLQGTAALQVVAGYTPPAAEEQICSSAAGDSAAPDAADSEVGLGHFGIWVKLNRLQVRIQYDFAFRD